MTQDITVTSSVGYDTLDVESLLQLLVDSEEIALIDVREQGVHARDGHIIHSVSLPLSILEQQILTLIPRRDVRIVVVDGGDGALSGKAVLKLSEHGFNNLAILQGGTAAWQQAGQQIYTGSSSYSKAFGEFVEATYATPHLDATELKARLDAGEVLLVDGRTLPEFREFSIPGAHPVPNGELPLRIHTLLKDPATPVVVNCAGRTRSIIGAQALINSGLPNPVSALEDGTMAWLFAGQTLQYGNEPSLPDAESLEVRQAAISSVDRLTRRFGIQWLDGQEIDLLRQEEGQRSLFLLDIRTRAEYDAGHLSGARWAEGGELIQGLDKFVGIRGARVVLLDDEPGVRAAITASWLLQLNRCEVYAHIVPEYMATSTETPSLALPKPEVATVDVEELAALIDRGSVVLIDLANSVDYGRGHIPGAHFAIRSRLLSKALNELVHHDETLVLTSPNGELACWVAVDLANEHALQAEIRVLQGGTNAWRATGLPTEQGAISLLHEPEDVSRSPYHQTDRFGAFRAYLTWERQLLTQIRQDSTINFRVYPGDTD